MLNKFELSDESLSLPTGQTLYRIRALKDFNDVKVGDLGGYVEHEDNLDQNGVCWVYDNAKVYDKAVVRGDARVSNSAEVFGCAKVIDNARVGDCSRVFGYAIVCNYAWIFGNTNIAGNVLIRGTSEIKSDDHLFVDKDPFP